MGISDRHPNLEEPNRCAPRFRFHDQWSVEGTAEEAADIFLNYSEADKWWPACFLRAEVLEEGDSHGVGRIVRALTKGMLPYSLHVLIRVNDADPLKRYELEFRGDLNGKTEVRISEKQDTVELSFDSDLVATKAVIQNSPWIFKPIFAQNHYWVMARGEVSLQREILRRRSSEGTWMGQVKSPPRPTFPHNLRWLVDKIRWKSSVSQWSR